MQLIQYKTPYAQPDGTAESQSHKRKTQNKNNEIYKNMYEEELQLKRFQRAKTKIADIALCNKFDMFVTFTANCKKCNQGCKNDPKLTGKKSGCSCNKATCKRFDVEYQRRNVFAWLNHQKKIHTYFSHLMVMELHENGAIHFHALLNGYTGKLVEHEIDPEDNKMIYNLVENKRGFTTVKLITDTPEDHAKVASYLTKYITKDMPLFPGRKRYVCSKGMNRPVVIENPKNIENLLKHPDATVWSPPTEPYTDKKTKRTVYPKPTNVELILTLLLDNTARYNRELELSRSIAKPTLSQFARTALRARAHLNRMSSGAMRDSLAEDCPRVEVLELEA